MIAINKHSSKLKDWSVEMTNAPYSEHWLQGGNKNGFTENDLCKEMRKLKIKYDSTDDKDRIKNYGKHLLNYFKGKTHEC